MSSPYIKFGFMLLFDVIIGSVVGITIPTIILINILAVFIGLGLGYIISVPLMARGCSQAHSLVVSLNALPLIYLLFMIWFGIPTMTMFWFLLWGLVASFSYSLIFGSDA